jgi:hypothetical protein
VYEVKGKQVVIVFARIFLTLSMLVVGLGSLTVSVSAQAPEVSISEIRIDQDGTDLDEYFELAGAADTALDGLTYIVLGDGTVASGVIEAVVDLAGLAIPASGYFVAAEDTFTLGTADLTTDLNFENSDNVTHMLVYGFTGANGADLDTDDDGILDVTPWTEIVDSVALIESPNPPTGTEWSYGDVTVGPDGSFVPGHAFVCAGTWQVGDFTIGDDTPGLPNACGSAESVTALVSSENPVDAGIEVTFTATVTSAGGGGDVPSGNMLFEDGTAVIGAAVLDGVGEASFSTSSLSGGDHTINAVYSGDGTYAGSTGTISQTVIAPLVAPDVKISEIRIDQPGSDNDEYFELTGAADTPLDGLTYIVIGDGSGGDGVIESVTDLTGQVVPASGYFVAAESTFTLGTPDMVTNLNFENSDNVTHMLVFQFAGSDGEDLDTNDDGVLDVTPWDEVIDSVAMIEEPNPPSGTEYSYSDTILGPDSGGYVPGHVVLCSSGWAIGVFELGVDDTPGAPSVCTGCGDPYLPIYDVQGNGSASTFNGDVVTVEGVVTGDFQLSSQLSGFFLQDPNGDGYPSTSDGVFVYARAGWSGIIDVNVGDKVRLSGTVDEYYDLTEITDVSNMLLCETGDVIVPTDVSLPVSSIPLWEQYESMLLTFPQTLTATENYNLGRYGEVLMSSGGRLYVPTNDQDGTTAENDLRELLIDDGSGIQNPAVVPYLEPRGTLRVGDTLEDLTGNLYYSFGTYVLEPTATVAFDPTNVRPVSPADVGGTIKAASFNVLNYFTDWGCPDCRGANDEEEFLRQKAKIVNAILGLDADVVALMEIENNGDTAVADLVDGLNAASEPDTYAYIPDPVEPFGTDAIKVALIYKPASVTPVGDAMADFDPIFDRPPLAQTFEFHGDMITVITNHFKSKGCTDATGDNLDYGQGCYNAKRILQAEQLLSFIADIQEESGDPDVLVLGDLNSYGLEDPIDTLKAGGLVNEIAANVPLESRYTYVYNGESGYLDQALSTPSLSDFITGVDLWHINADEPRVLDYNEEYNPAYVYSPDAYRSSDHDPVLVGVCEATPPTIDAEVTPQTLWSPNHKYVTVETTVDVTDNVDTGLSPVLVSVTSNEPDNGLGDGDMPDDIVILDDFTFQLRAERAGLGDGRVYTITYMATDSCGNTTYKSVTVTVPKSEGIGKSMKPII